MPWWLVQLCKSLSRPAVAVPAPVLARLCACILQLAGSYDHYHPQRTHCFARL